MRPSLLLAVLSLVATLAAAGCARYHMDPIESSGPGTLAAALAQETASDPPSPAQPLARRPTDRGTAAADAPLPEKLTLAEAVAIARDRNPDLAAAAARIAGAQSMVRAAWAPFYPGLTLDAGAARSNSAAFYLFKRLEQRDVDPAQDFQDPNRPGNLTNYEVGATLRYNLFRGGRDRAALAVAHTEQALARTDREDIRNELVAAVTTTFHDIISADELSVAEQAQVETVRAQLEETRARFRAGSVLEDEVLTLQVRLAEAERRHIAAQNTGRLARAALAGLLAAPTESVTGLECRDVPPPGVPATFEEGLDLARRRNPRLGASRLRVEQATHRVGEARGGFWPTLGVFARAYHDDDELFDGLGDGNWVLGADVQWEIFSGFGTRSRAAAAEAGRRRAEAVLRRAALDLEQAVRAAYIRLDNARAQRRVTEAAVAHAAKSQELVERRYRGGAVTVTRYLEAVQDRTIARVNAIRARCDERRALADVARALGWWTETVEGER